MGEQTGLSWLAHPKPREGQIEMIASCLETLQKGGANLASAPTGIGKTAAALAAALEFANSGPQRKTVMFLTPRQSQHKIVVDTVRRINEISDHEKISLVDMIGQSGMCVEPFAGNRGASFSLLCANHRKNRQCKPWLTSAPAFERRILSDPLHVDQLVEMSKTHVENGQKTQTCPWKAARNAAKEAQVIVCDYNHLFIEGVRNASLKAMGLRLDDLVVIVDEAHNLPDRVRKGMQSRLTPTMVRNAISEIEEHYGNLQRASMVNDSMGDSLELKKWSLEVCKEFRQVLTREFKRLVGELSRDDEMEIQAIEVLNWLDEAFDKVSAHVSQSTLTGSDNVSLVPKKNIRLKVFKELLETNEVDVDEDGDNEPSAHLLAQQIDVLDRFGNGTALCLVFDGQGRDGRIITHLLDAGLVAGPIFEQVSGSILMSGTLNPPSMFADLLGITNKTRGQLILESPFAKERRPIVVATDVTTLYRERSEENTARIRDHISSVVQNTPGNVAVFVPSYSALEQIFDGTMYLPGTKKLVESKTWSKQDINSLLIELEEAPKRGRKIVIAGVFNGRLSEGVDYAGGILDTVICVGIQNAPPSVFQKAYANYIKDKFGQGNFWRYANSQPAINTILQAMGRPIRAMGDRALIVLLDRRNIERTYSICYPPDIRMNQVSDSDGSGRFAKRFFAKVQRKIET
ncbi:MAG: ATP-dependent DNA helicase [Candidatus Poseidoniaceae archaeon]|tara:strand:+ start:1425 stop:3488 length:2064 start_codon:yes stop_codon:yes gene_type:complete